MAMTKNKKGLLIAGAIAVLGVATYLLYRNNKKRYAKEILSLNGSAGPYAILLTFDEGFLKEWAAGLRKGATSFSYQGNNYNTSGGKKII